MLALEKDKGGYLPLSFCLSVMKELEVLIEVAAEHYKGRDRKWNILAAVEAIKACLRFLILHRSGYRMLIDGGETRHVVGGSGASPQQSSFAGSLMERGTTGTQIRNFSAGYMGHVQATKSSLPQSLERKATLAMKKLGENLGINPKPSWVIRSEKNTESSAEFKEISCTPNSISPANWDLPDELLVVGEWVFILRPLIYVLLIRRYGLTSWRPWLTSLAVDVTGMSAIFIAGILKKKRQGQFPLSSNEIQELKRRQLLWALYMMRDPFFSTYTRYSLCRTERMFRPVPLIGSLGEKVVEFIIGIQTRYSYTAAS